MLDGRAQEKEISHCIDSQHANCIIHLQDSGTASAAECLLYDPNATQTATTAASSSRRPTFKTDRPTVAQLKQAGYMPQGLRKKTYMHPEHFDHHYVPSRLPGRGCTLKLIRQ